MELLSAILFPVGFLALFTALGAGPLALFGGHLRGRGALMPIVGCALAATLLTDVSPLLPMRSAAWLVLLPAAALSVLLALASRPGPGIGVSDLVAASTIGVGGALIASIPAIRAGTPGPRALHIYDALLYISVDDLFRDNRLGGRLPAGDAGNLSLIYAHAAVHFGGRVGADEINAAASVLMRASASETHFALLAVLYGLGAAGSWFCARSLGLSVLAAGTAAAFALSAGFLVLVYDTALGNLAGLVMASAATVCFYHGISSGDRGTLVLTSIAFAGLLAVFPEFLLPTLAVAAASVLVVAVAAFRARVALLLTARAVLGRLALVSALTIVLAPVPLLRAAQYLTKVVQIRSQTFGVPRPIGIETFLPWAFGFAHLYELQLFEAIGGVGHTFVLGIAVAFVLALVLSSTRRSPAWLALVATPIVAALTIGIASGSAFSGGACEYCRWKAWTFMLPFLGLGLAFAVDAGEAVLSRRVRGKLGSAPPRLLAGLSIVAALIAPAYVLASTDGRLVAASSAWPAAVGPDLRAVTSAAGRATGHRQGLFLDGTDAVPAANFTIPATYELLGEVGVERVSLDARNPTTVAYLGAPDPSAAYRPDYALVLSPFAGLRSGRRTLVRAGNYVLQRRAVVDVGLAGEGVVVDPREGKNAIPWIVGPFELWVASPFRWSGSIVIGLQQPSGGTGSVVLAAGGRPLRMTNTDETICADVRFSAGRTTIEVLPTFNPLSVVAGVPKVLGISSIRTKTVRCTM